ncbi:MAG TPA: hypothetical protein VK395_01735 [Gemmataceae bacterium]|nr:hypothetical protein [Gemmataceae bacterium]
MVTSSLDCSCVIREFATVKEQWRIERPFPSCPVYSLAISPSGEELYIADRVGLMQLWNLKTGQTRLQGLGFDLPSPGCAFTPDGKTVASIQGGVILLMETRDGHISNLTLNIDDISEGFLKVSPDGVHLATAVRKRKAVGLYELSTGKAYKKFYFAEGAVTSAAFSPDGRTLVVGRSGARDGVTFCDIRSGARWSGSLGPESWDENHAASSLSETDGVSAVTFAPSGSLVASAGYDGKVRLWNAQNGLEVSCFEYPYAKATALEFSPDGRYLASGYADGVLMVWPTSVRVRNGRILENRLSADEIASCWRQLGETTSAAIVYESAWRLVSAPGESVAALRRLIQPLRCDDTGRVSELISNLDSDDYHVRKEATDRLGALGIIATSQLKTALRCSDSLEVRRRIQGLLAMPPMPPEVKRQWLGLQILEVIATPESERVIQDLAAGSRKSWLTNEAVACLARIRQRTAIHQ